MKNVGDYIIYRRDVCKIIGIKEKHFNDEDYYVLEPISDKSLHIDVPINNKMGYIRDLISEDEISVLINKIPDIDVIEEDSRKLEIKYKELLDNGSHEDLIRIIKTTYSRNKERIDNKKKISEKDKHFLDLAEHYLYDEISVVLNMSYEATKKFIIDKLESFYK